MTTKTESQNITDFDIQNVKIGSAIIGGLAGTVAFGLLMMLMGNDGTITMAIPALYGISGPSVGVGWGIHLFHGAVLGLVYAGIASIGPVREHSERLGPSIGLGAAYGVLTTVVLAAFLMPVWLGVVGFPKAPPAPNFNVAGLVGHIVYGVVLAVIYAKVDL